MPTGGAAAGWRCCSCSCRWRCWRGAPPRRRGDCCSRSFRCSLLRPGSPQRPRRTRSVPKQRKKMMTRRKRTRTRTERTKGFHSSQVTEKVERSQATVVSCRVSPDRLHSLSRVCCHLPPLITQFGGHVDTLVHHPSVLLSLWSTCCRNR